MPLSWPGVELSCNEIALLLVEVGHAGSFGQVLANKAVGVFVAAAFPGVMRCREVEAGPCGLFNVLIPMELGAVVSGDGFDVVAIPMNDRDHALIQSLFGSVFELSDDQKTGFALDQSDDATLGTTAHTRINLPMADGASRLDDGWSLGDVVLAGQAAAAVVGAVTFSSLFGGAA